MAQSSVTNQISDLSNHHRLPDGYSEWKKDVADYVDKKKNFQGVAEPYRKVTNAFIKQSDTIYNPITQVYNNSDKEMHHKQTEQSAMLNTLASNKDRALRYEQTYNILNFDNKLKGLEDRHNYPKAKPWYFRPERDTYCDYNILSNVDVKEHHFQPPDKRPILEKPKEKEFISKQGPPRDYNVVTNKYLHQNDLKVATNDDIMRNEAAKRYWKTHDFDHIQGKYCDDDKETTFRKERESEAKIHGKDYCKKLPITVQNEGLMYNPVNMKIEDETRLLEKDQRDKSKKQRYGVRYDVEDVVRRECLADFERESDMALRRISHKRAEEQVNRGFDIMTNGELPTALAILKEEKQPYAKKPAQAWNQTSSGAQSQIDASNNAAQKAQMQASAAANSNVELKGTKFGDRMTRHANVGKGIPIGSVGSQRSVRTGGFQKLGAEISSH